MVKPGQTDSSSTSNSPAPWNKRRKAEDHTPEMNSPASKKPRTRVSYSCGECHRRKQKCDRQVPCAHCVARKVPELCKAYTPGKSDQDLPARVSRLEQIIEAAFPHLAPGSPPSSMDCMPNHPSRSASTGPDEDTQSQLDENDPGAGTFSEGKWYGDTVSGSVAPGTVLEQLQHVVPHTKNPPHGESGGPYSSGQSQVENEETALGRQLSENANVFDPMTQAWEPSAADNLNTLIKDCGVSQQTLSDSLQELPPQPFCDVLVDFYFSSINWTRYPISERDFRASYSSIRSNGAGGQTNDVRFLPLLFVILAIAVRLAPERIAGATLSKRQLSMRYYWSSRRALLIAAAVQPDSLDMILIRLMSARFLTFDRRITECWSQLGAAVRTAQALGLHRDGAAMGLDPAQVEYRRRIWSYLLHADRSYALVLGRPNAIQDDYTSTLPPSNIDDDFTPSRLGNPHPLTTPTHMTFVILRHTLASIIGRMVHHFQQVRTRNHYTDVLALDDELMRFVETLPPHFAMDPDTTLDQSLNYLPVHRHLLITEILFVRISLHRPYLLRRLGSDRYSHSRRACFESALKDFQVRQAFKESMCQDDRTPHTNAYREFQTAMISGIYLVLEPDGKDALAMHAILDAFMADHDSLPDMDFTTRRELKIIEFLKGKSREGVARGAQRSAQPTSPTRGANGDAHLLLSLQRSALQASGASSRRPSQAAYPSLVISPSLATSSSPSDMSSSPLAFVNGGNIAPHPLVHAPMLSESYQPTPTMGSPGSDGEDNAQSLLDHWCNTVNGFDGFGGSAPLALGASDYMGWMPPPVAPSGAEPCATMGLDRSDWSFWETLVSQIRSGPIP